MSPSKANGNELCSCGSGKVHSQCCLRANGSLTRGSAESAGAGAGLREALAGRVFGCLDEAQEVVAQFSDQRHRTVRAEFHGLSPNQMHRLLHLPFDSKQVVSFPERLGVVPDAPVLTLFEYFAEHIDEKGLKLTAKGNLPRKLCREAALAHWGEERYRDESRFCRINTERDFFDLHVTRLTAELAGLVHKRKGRFLLTRRYRSLTSRSGATGVYHSLLRTYAERYNWGYPDGFAELLLVQQSFAFTLYLLSLYGETERPQTFYEDAFMSAFPMLLQEVSPSLYASAEEQIRRCFTVRALVRFAAFFGLAEAVPVEGDELSACNYRVRKGPTLDAAVQFHVSMD